MKNKDTPKWVKRICAVVFFGLILIVAVPIIINECYKNNSGYLTMWTASDMLSYYGMILAACGTVAGVFLSIKWSQSQYKEDIRNSALPYLAINKLGRNCINPFDRGWYEDEFDRLHTDEDYYGKIKDALTYSEYKHTKNYFVINNSSLKFTENLSDKQKEAMETGCLQEVKCDGGGMWKTNVCYFPYDIQNVGNGCAINLKISLVKGEVSASTFCLSLPANSTTYVGVLVEDLCDEDIGLYTLEFKYEDIYGHKYCQSKQIHIDKDGMMFYIFDSQDATQMRVD